MYYMNRETVAVADLIPNDIILPEGWVVIGYPHGVPAMSGSVVWMDRFAKGIYIGQYYPDSEAPVQILRD